MSSRPRATRSLLVALSAFLLLQCDDGPTAPTVGSVGLSTTDVTLAVAEDRTVTATVRTTGGETLTDVAVTWGSSNASVATVSPVDGTGRQARITAMGVGSTTITATAEGASAQVAVTVVPRAGTLTVRTATIGSHPDADGFALDVSAGDSAWTMAVAVNDTVVIEAVPEGDAAVSLSGLAVNCYPDGEADRTVAVAHEQTVATTFDIDCKVPVASLEVSPDSIDVGVGDTMIVAAFARDSAGNVLTDRPVAWSVTDTTVLAIEAIEDGGEGTGPVGGRALRAPPATDDEPEATGQARVIGKAEGAANVGARVEDAETAPRVFVIRRGTLVVEYVVFGEYPAEGFSVQVDLLLPDGTKYSDSAAFFYDGRTGYSDDNRVSENTYDLVVSEITACRVSTPTPISATVRYQERTTVWIHIVCPNPGTVEVATTTTGDWLPPSGYQAWVEGVGKAIAINGSVVFERVAEGSRTVRLTDVPPNCAGPQAVAVTIEDDVPAADGGHPFAAKAAFELTCSEQAPGAKVVAGTKTTYLLQGGGATYVAGWNEHGQLGLGDIDNRARFVAAQAWQRLGAAMRLLVGGHRNTMAVYDDGRVYGAGDNSSGWMGDGSTSSNDQPTEMGIDDVVSADLGDQTACVAKSDGSVHCAGSAEHKTNGQTFDTDQFYEFWIPEIGMDQTVPGISLHAGTTSWTAFVPRGDGGAPLPGSRAASGAPLADEAPGTVYTWGMNDVGQLGTGSEEQHSLTPVEVAGEYVAVSSGLSHNCALGTDGQVYCWGWNSVGQLGDGTTTNRGTPTAVAGGATFAAISAGAWKHTCALTPEGAAYCWGDNTFGQLGDGTTENRLVPTPVAGGLTFAMISAGWTHTCGVTTGDDIYCWGHNDMGQLADGTNTDRSVPTLAVFDEP